MLVHVMFSRQVFFFLSQIAMMYCYLIHLYCALEQDPFYADMQMCMGMQLRDKFSSAYNSI